MRMNKADRIHIVREMSFACGGIFDEESNDGCGKDSNQDTAARAVAVNTAPFGISGSSLKIIGLTARI